MAARDIAAGPSRLPAGQQVSARKNQNGEMSNANANSNTQLASDDTEERADSQNGGVSDSGPSGAAQVAVAHSAQLADMIISEPYRFAIKDGDVKLQEKSMEALKSVFDYALASEAPALPSIAKALESAIAGDETDGDQRATRAGGKRKREDGSTVGKHNAPRLFEETRLSELTTDGMGLPQVWEQLELRNAKFCRILDAIIVKDEEAADEDDEDDEESAQKRRALSTHEEEEEGDEDTAPLDEVESKIRRKKQDGEPSNDESDDDALEEGSSEDDLDHEEIVRDIKSLSDAELRAMGIGPSQRHMIESGTMDLQGSEEDGEDGEGYPGASDLSDDDEDAGRILTEPLQTEEQQMKRKAEQEERERQEMQKRIRIMRQIQGHDPDAVHDEEEDDDDDGEDGDFEEADEDDYDDGESDESDEDDSEEEEESEDGSGTGNEQRPAFKILDNFDARKDGQGSGKLPRRHAELDDDFFSIDQFNADTDDYGDEGVDLGEDVDLFKNMDEEEEEEQENPLYYADFFAPPPYHRVEIAGKDKREISSQAQPQAAGKQYFDSVRGAQKETAALEASRPRVRFHDEVKIRKIKARHERPDPLNEVFGLLDGGKDQEHDDEQEGEASDADGEDEDEDIYEDYPESDEELEGESVARTQDEEDEAEIEDSISVDDVASKAGGDSDEEQETAQRVAGDLFDDDSGSEAEVERDELSGHERRLQALQQEIARLEEENVAKKDWTLMGESSSRARPENSLLEEDLEFESNTKAKPVMTAEVTTSIEDMIKRRILENNFDDVQRRATLNPMDFIPSKMLELSDQKSGKSLDQVYEDELGLGDGADSRGAQLDKEMQKEHEEIDGLYDALERQLDALSNAHYTPKAPKVSIQTMTNTPAITLEESLPSSMSHASQLAPEEVYDAGGRHNVALEGDSGELTPEEKKRRHRQLREEKRNRNERIAAHRKNVEINREAFGQDRGGRFAGGSKSGKRAGEEKDAALRKLMGNKGISVVGKGNEANGKKQRSKPSAADLNASHLKL